MSKNKKTANTVWDLIRPDRIDIMKRVAANESIKEIASDYNIRYAAVRNVVMSEWQKSFPKHFAKFANPRTVGQFKKNPPKFK